MSIKFDSSSKTFYLDTKSATYAFFINSYGFAEHLYFGKRIHQDYLLACRTGGRNSFSAKIPTTDDRGISSYQDMPPEISFFGTGDYREPTVLPQFEDGSRVTELLYVSHEIVKEKPKMQGMPSMDGGETLILYLYDEKRKFGAELYYTLYPDCNVIARRAVYRNCSDEVINLKRAYSFSMGLPKDSYDAITLYGGWACERCIERTPLHHGVFSIDSKRSTSSAVLNPFMAVVGRGTTETSGNAYGVSLIYSSSFVLKAETVISGDTVLSGGINDFDFSWRLESGDALECPEVALAYSDEGIGGMSREYHRAFRKYLIQKRFVNVSRPIVINNWEGTYFKFTADKLKAIADCAAGTGIDTFVLDDGWFGKREDDTSGLGDWVVNEEKLVGGLEGVIDHVHSIGMKFGLWFEPEMISPDSDLFRAHPDYAIGLPDRERSLSRHQYMLDLTRPEVCDYIVNAINAILSKYDIDYVKWDYNRNATEFYSLTAPADRQSEFAHRYALGLYDICERIVNGNPKVFFEGCSGGGARFDPAMLYYFSQIWTSDDSDAEERTRIQYGTSIVYPLSTMSCHVSAVPNHQVARVTPLKTRGDIASLGATGYELDTTKLDGEQLKQIAEQVSQYKKHEQLILDGDLYRIENPFESNFFSFAVVAPDKSAAKLVCYKSLCEPNPECHRVKMAGLDENKEYFIPELNLIMHGSTLMNFGFAVSFPKGDFMTKVYTFEEK